LRFLGRRVYLEAVVLVASVIAATRGCGRDTGRVVGVGPRTLGRWVAWWRGSFLETLVFVTLAGALAMGTSRARGCMPVSLWAASPVAEGAETVRWLARALAPLTTTSFGSPIVRGIP
jgi:hypothetical protein